MYVPGIFTVSFKKRVFVLLDLIRSYPQRLLEIEKLMNYSRGFSLWDETENCGQEAVDVGIEQDKKNQTCINCHFILSP